MGSEDNSVPHTSDQFQEAESSASSSRLAESEPTTGGLTMGQGPLQIDIDQLNNKNQSVGTSMAENAQISGLHLRHGYHDQEQQHTPSSYPSDRSVNSPKLQTMHVADEINDTSAENESIDTIWSESTIVPRRNLGFVQITALMLNGTIGSGIFITPGYVLLLTQSKTIALVLWVLGGVYTALRYIALCTRERYG